MFCTVVRFREIVECYAGFCEHSFQVDFILFSSFFRLVFVYNFSSFNYVFLCVTWHGVHVLALL